jgi:hypothetical protein
MSCPLSSLKNKNKRRGKIVPLAGSGKLKYPETNVMHGLIAKNHALMCIVSQLIDKKKRLNSSIRYFWLGENREY